MKNLARTEIARVVAKRLNVSRADAMLVLEASIAFMAEAVAQGRALKLRNLGTIAARPRGQIFANAINAKGLREWAHVPPHMIPKFMPCKKLKQEVRKIPVPKDFRVRVR